MWSAGFVVRGDLQVEMGKGLSKYCSNLKREIGAAGTDLGVCGTEVQAEAEELRKTT